MSNVRTISTSIAVGQSRTEAIALNQFGVTGMFVSGSRCTASYVGFEVSPDGNTYYPLIGIDNAEVLVTVTTASRAFALETNDFIGWNHIKIREGTSASPVLQSGFAQPISLMIRSVPF